MYSGKPGGNVPNYAPLGPPTGAAPPPTPAARAMPAGKPDATSVAIVFGTYNRRALLEQAVYSARRAAGNVNYQMIVIDGGSTDGSQDWLRKQEDVVLIEQSGPLTGAVKAFNLGFAHAVERGFPFVAHFNDDAEYRGPKMLQQAVAMMRANPQIGAVAYEFDLRGRWDFESVHGKLYTNFGVIRREAGMAAAVAAGDPTGKAWWNPIYKTYGADTELGCWLWKLGWIVHGARGLRVHDSNVHDALRTANDSTKGPHGRHPDSVLFYSRWPTAASLNPTPKPGR